jgi:hypothetical protein
MSTFADCPTCGPGQPAARQRIDLGYGRQATRLLGAYSNQDARTRVWTGFVRCGTCNADDVPRREIKTTAGAAKYAVNPCNGQCTSGKRSCDCRCGGKCHGAGRCLGGHR